MLRQGLVGKVQLAANLPIWFIDIPQFGTATLDFGSKLLCPHHHFWRTRIDSKSQHNISKMVIKVRFTGCDVDQPKFAKCFRKGGKVLDVMPHFSSASQVIAASQLLASVKNWLFWERMKI